MIKRGPFTREEIDALDDFGGRLGFLGFVFDPLHEPGSPFESPPSYVEMVRKGFDLVARQKLLAGLEVSAVVDGLVQAYRLEQRGEKEAADRVSAELLSALPQEALPAASKFVQQVLEQVVSRTRDGERRFRDARSDFEKLLTGSEAERQDFIDSYEYDLSASSDDAPFFFNYYRYSGLFARERAEKSKGSTYNPDFPVGHMVLVSSLLQIMVLGVVSILAPLRTLARRGITISGVWRVFAYFAALGLGFMFIEIVTMQRMVLFLGHPIYAVSVVLPCLLGAAGVGSLLSGRVREISPRTPVILAGAILIFLTASVLATTYVLPELLGQSFPVRVAVVISILTPLGLVLGMPFPLGIRIVAARRPQLLPWAWAINAFLSVFSSISSIILAMAVGFSTVLAIAGVAYAVGLLAMVGFLRSEGAILPVTETGAP